MALRPFDCAHGKLRSGLALRGILVGIIFAVAAAAMGAGASTTSTALSTETAPATAPTAEQLRQEAQEKKQKAEDERLARQIEHAKKQVEAAEAELDAITDSGYDSSIKRKYVIRDGRRYYRAVDGPNGRGADMKVAQETLAVVKTRLAELEAKAKERGLTTSTTLSAEDPAAIKAENQKLKAEVERLKAENARLKSQLGKAG